MRAPVPHFKHTKTCACAPTIPKRELDALFRRAFCFVRHGRGLFSFLRQPVGSPNPEGAAGGASGEPEIRPLDAPVAIPLGDAHSVHTLGPDPSLWAYVFAIDPGLERQPGG